MRNGRRFLYHVDLKPGSLKERWKDQRPGPGPRRQRRFPERHAPERVLATCCAAICAVRADFLVPLKPTLPPDAQVRTFRLIRDDMIVLLNVECDVRHTIADILLSLRLPRLCVRFATCVIPL